MHRPTIDSTYVERRLLEMLAIPSPTGFTDEIVRYVCTELTSLSIDFELTRRGTIVGTIPGQDRDSSRAIVSHLDTIGAMVTGLKANGRLALSPVGAWSSRFAEGGRATVYTQKGVHRGQVLPLLASGHAFDRRVDQLPVAWDQVEMRLNRDVSSTEDLEALGVGSGDFVAFDADPEHDGSGYISSRHLDNKAGASAVLATLLAIRRDRIVPNVDLRVVFTVTEEIGTGGATILDANVTEYVGVDVAPVAEGQVSCETALTLCAQDAGGPFNRPLLLELRRLCHQHSIPYRTDVFRYYYSDAHPAIVAGNDIRDALIAFGTDATHGYERTHLDSLRSVALLLTLYSQRQTLMVGSATP